MLSRIRTLASELALIPTMWRHLVVHARNELELPERCRRDDARAAAVKEALAARGYTLQDLHNGRVI